MKQEIEKRIEQLSKEIAALESGGSAGGEPAAILRAALNENERLLGICKTQEKKPAKVFREG